MITYEPLNPDDWEAVRDVALKSWHFTYKDIYSKDFIDTFIENHYSEKAIRSGLEWANKNNGWNYVAKDGEQIVGYVTFGKDGNAWRLWRIYLLPEYFGGGIGLNLLSMGEEFVKNQGAASYFLYVHKDNTIGKRFYMKNGFTHNPSRDNTEGELYLEKSLI